ncbi:type VI secretion system accessory protein TagJ [Swingsia samuiensis]|uniref:Tetratricopeptide repeat protein n=1 Tax=Swingsia samuiensis TaxID=1293412 RepID=A0A4Y6UFK9_9PROT|nr:type VI secretion system accessory protein TagJ [Swingsia samuiensis]QDH16329.1 tetratricopeptide repeat protein [Swingsia samuiensis]
MTLSADTLFQQGDLEGAIAAATAAVKANPSDPAPRLLLAELSLFMGDLQRAETLIAALLSIDPNMSLVAAEFRQLLRAETQRRAILEEGAAPEFVLDPTPSQKESLRALTALRTGDTKAAIEAAQTAESLRVQASGSYVRSGKPTEFDDFRDADDILCGSIEILTTTGKCFWIPLESFIEITFHAPRRPRDLFWRRASVVVRGGPEGEVYLPALYYPSGNTNALRLGRETDWISDQGPVRGQGQRVFLAGEEALDILQAEEITFG